MELVHANTRTERTFSILGIYGMDTTTPGNAAAFAASFSLLTFADLEQVTTLDRRTIHRLIKRGDFPRPVALPGAGESSRRRAWRSEEVKAWIEALPSSNGTTSEGAQL